jgi:uncharacterized membrane-anchored protein YhcB (DUF1043 family)
MKKTSRQIGIAIIFISILLTYINAVIDTTNKKNQKDDEINYGDIAIRQDKYNSEIEKEFNSVREGNLTDELKFLIQKDTYSKYNEELSTEEEELIKNLVFPDLYKRKKDSQILWQIKDYILIIHTIITINIYNHYYY